MYYTVKKHSDHLRRLEKCRNTRLRLVFSTFPSSSQMTVVFSQCNTRLRILYLLNKNSVNSTRNIYKVMVFEIQVLAQKVTLFQKSTISTLKRFPKGKFQIRKSRPVFASVILQSLAISMQSMLKRCEIKASNELYFLPLILAK